MFSASRFFSWSVLLLVLVVLAAGCGKGGGDSTGSTESTGSEGGGGDSTGSTEPAGSEGAGSQKRIIIVTNGTSPFWDAAKIGAQEAAEDLDVAKDGLRVVVDTNDFSDKGQIDKLRSYQGL